MTSRISGFDITTFIGVSNRVWPSIRPEFRIVYAAPVTGVDVSNITIGLSRLIAVG